MISKYNANQGIIIFLQLWGVYGRVHPGLLSFHGQPHAQGQALDLLPPPPYMPIFWKPFQAAQIASNGFGAVSINDNPPGD
jgi:hypothetical protein